MPYQLVYSSVPTKKMISSHLYLLLREVRLKNKLSQITGLLVFVDDMFLQVLEGNEKDVKTVFEKISRDARHANIETLFEGHIAERAFPNWAMAYASASTRELGNWSGLNNTTTIQDILSHITTNPTLVPGIFKNLLTKISETEQDLDDPQ